jgi:hypothetical protein
LLEKIKASVACKADIFKFNLFLIILISMSLVIKVGFLSEKNTDSYSKLVLTNLVQNSKELLT